MLSIPRSVVRTVWDVLRRCVKKPYRGLPPPLTIQGVEQGLRFCLPHESVCVLHDYPGCFAPERIRLPLDALDDFARKTQEVVTLEGQGNGRVLARWQEKGVPRFEEYDCAEEERYPLPGTPKSLTPNPPELLTALEEARKSTARSGVRFALERVLLRGKSGQVVGTDGKQLLIQDGFRFPWTEDVLISPLPIFTDKGVGSASSVEVGRTEDHVALCAGPWTFFLKIDKEARYPDFQSVIPRRTNHLTRWRIDPDDAAFLENALPHLPGEDDDHEPVTVDLNGAVKVRARGSGPGKATEVVLSRSDSAGGAVRFCIHRGLLGRMLQLGFRDVDVVDAKTPILCQDPRRTFVMMPLDAASVLEPSEDPLRIVSAEGEQPAPLPCDVPFNGRTRGVAPVEEDEPIPLTIPERREDLMPSPRNQTQAPMTPPPLPRTRAELTATQKEAFEGLLAEAEALRQALKDSHTRAGKLVTALKKWRKQSKLLRAAVASLKQLNEIQA